MADNSEVKALSEVFFGNCWTYAGAALLAYDYILTFNSEVTLFWMGGRLSGATILFLLNRYITLAAQIFNAAPIPPSVESAFSEHVVNIVLLALQYPPWAAFSALRSYALCPNPYRWPISATVFALSLVPFVTNMWGNLYKMSFVDDPKLGMIPTNPISSSTQLKLEAATRSSMIASDFLVLCVTWYRTYETAKLTLRSLGNKTFASILLLDGVEHNTLVNDALTAAAVLEWSLSPILTSRFLIDLQKAQRKLEASSRSFSLGELEFEPQTSRNTSRLIGSLGAQLAFHEDEDEANEMEDAS
ncbi:hypothetical protein DICSQDRAFT_141170 [Dichomitus squalens LYAD-421 SS1]|uniref:DUF6533 domain-containing protein n=1 Tax=Dichomitus squalens (strain LYAD-421) TaxID=732165 RepID=R7SK77_DICSQ|nr:uncharacterized protein DICSQDRAFT_141170 [Dichomitus squalens LYAD-421 SS1]EJF56544.1 hypothetical protein DICSQDRAFT_141170 [Dichomitus squalens LYAD-421 SS1]